MKHDKNNNNFMQQFPNVIQKKLKNWKKMQLIQTSSFRT